MSQTNAAKAWLSTALAEIARLSGIDITTNLAAADDMFQDPMKVWSLLDRLSKGASLSKQRDVFMDFEPPIMASSHETRKSLQAKKKTKAKKSTPKSLKLTFTTTEQDSVSLLSSEGIDTTARRAQQRDTRLSIEKDKERNGRGGGRSTSVKPVDTPKAIAEKASIKAFDDAYLLLKKFPPVPGTNTFFEDFLTVPDQYGFRFPVVYINNRAHPMTQENLLLSRKKHSSIIKPTYRTSYKGGKSWASSSSDSRETSNRSDGHSVGLDTTVLVENASVGSNSTKSQASNAQSTGSASTAISWAQVAAVRPFIPEEAADDPANARLRGKTKAVAVKPASALSVTREYTLNSEVSGLSNVLTPAPTYDVVAVTRDRQNHPSLAMRQLEAEVDYRKQREREIAKEHQQEVFALRAMISSLSEKMENISLLQNQKLVTAPSASQATQLTVRPDPFNDPASLVISPPPRRHKKSSLLALTSVAHSPPPLHSQLVKDAKKKRLQSPDGNRFSSLARAAHGHDEEEEIHFREEIDAMKVEDAEEYLKQMSHQSSKPGARMSGAGRRK